MPVGLQNDLAGRRFGRLKVLSFVGRAKNYISLWKCQCDCGEMLVCRGGNLTSGDSKSCGCGHGIRVTDPITHEQLLKLVCYKKRTGHFVALRNWCGVRVGTPIGSVDIHSGYQQICLAGTIYYAHILAWFYVTGAWPTVQVDHWDTVRHNNAWRNLRLANGTQNNANHPVRKDSGTGLKGVAHSLRKGKPYRAMIRAYGKQKTLGYFDTATEAAIAYDAAARAQHGKFARTNFGVSL